MKVPLMRNSAMVNGNPGEWRGPGPRVAVACSGLGHVQRGIEAWAADLARGLGKAGVAVTLFGGGATEGGLAVPCLRRTSGGNAWFTRMFRHLAGWRYGLGSPYEVEQTSFALTLWLRVRRDFDILHVQDPVLARWFEWAWRMGLSRPRVIYANGTGADSRTMRRFQYLQVLTRQADDGWRNQRPAGQDVFMIPNFIDTRIFRPGDRHAARRRFGLPERQKIVLCCAAIRRDHKRIDALTAEFETVLKQNGEDVLLVVAGGRETDTNEIIARGTALLGDRVRFLTDVPRADMPELYRAANVFALASLHEMFGIVLLEAMASGLPVVCHDTSHFRSVVGPAGAYHDLTVEGELANGILSLLDENTRMALARRARLHVQRKFSETAVIPDVVAMYRSVLRRPAPAPARVTSGQGAYGHAGGKETGGDFKPAAKYPQAVISGQSSEGKHLGSRLEDEREG